jgi:hypothetical protein
MFGSMGNPRHKPSCKPSTVLLATVIISERGQQRKPGLIKVVSKDRLVPEGVRPTGAAQRLPEIASSPLLCLLTPDPRLWSQVGQVNLPDRQLPTQQPSFHQPQLHPPTLPPLAPSPASPQRCPHRPVECPVFHPTHQSCLVLPCQACTRPQDSGRVQVGSR